MLGTRSKINILGDPILRKKAKPLQEVTAEYRKLLSSMAASMYEHSGIGLAAPQIGVGARLIVVDIGEGLYKLANPKIVKRQGVQSIQEGCLSVPGACVKVRRSRRVWIEAMDENNRPLKIEAKDLFACVLQHEIDHLEGKLIVDYASLLEKLKIRRKLKELRKEARIRKL
ncbi:MAG: peptide deformylase [Candidatus Omnitrophica bacterium]|nr:peptide deformylase [Candidatus Omnitrophota bacterium]MDD5771113.1 peptide deformylase [Candidatus Omnitrophota bacterium]